MVGAEMDKVHPALPEIGRGLANARPLSFLSLTRQILFILAPKIYSHCIVAILVNTNRKSYAVSPFPDPFQTYKKSLLTV